MEIGLLWLMLDMQVGQSVARVKRKRGQKCVKKAFVNAGGTADIHISVPEYSFVFRAFLRSEIQGRIETLKQHLRCRRPDECGDAKSVQTFITGEGEERADAELLNSICAVGALMNVGMPKASRHSSPGRERRGQMRNS